jgi:hypothetical protein
MEDQGALSSGVRAQAHVHADDELSQSCRGLALVRRPVRIWQTALLQRESRHAARPAANRVAWPGGPRSRAAVGPAIELR